MTIGLGYDTIRIDGDSLRESLNFKDLSISGRTKLNKIAAHKAKEKAGLGYNVVVSIIAPTKAIRNMIRKIIPEVRFIFLPGGSTDLVNCPYEIPTKEEWIQKEDI